ncbi:MAG: prohibitin family protein [Candidatus Bathyarchaeia archaeon]
MDRRYEFDASRIEGLGVILIVVIIIIGGVLFFSIGRIGVGYVALVIDPVLGSTTVIGDGTNARLFFKTPWSNVFEIYIATDSIHMWTEGGITGEFPAVESLTRDGLKVDVDITVRWRISPSEVDDLFRQFPGRDWKQRAIIPIIRETIRDLIVEYKAIDTIEKRGTIAKMLEITMEEALTEEQSLKGAVILDAVDLRKISLPATFVNAIEKKLASQQLSIAAEYNKTRTLILANATAESKILEAEGLAISRLKLANATRDAIANIAADNPNIDPGELTRLYLYLETLRDISESGKGQFIVITGKNGEYILPIK